MNSEFKNFFVLIFFSIILILNKTFAQAQFSYSTNKYGKIELGQTKTITFKVLNKYNKDQIRLDSYWFNNSDSYLVDGGTCQFNGYIVKAKSSCTINIKFAPYYLGVQNDVFTLGYYKGSSWQWLETNLNLYGEGINSVVIAPSPSPTPILSPSPSSTPIIVSSTPTPTPIPTTAPSTGWLSVVGNKIVNDQGIQVILKGVNIADPEHLDIKTWERPNVSARSVASLATDQYFAKVIRLPILPGNSSYPNEGFFSPTNGKDVYFYNHVKPLVDELTAKGIYVIIDLHYISDYSSLYPKVQEFWTYMAPKFNNNPYVIYELFNEPILPDDWTTWKNTIAQPGVNLIRSFAPNNLILVGGPYWSSHMAGAATNPVSGTNIVYVGHVYSNQTPSMWASRYEPVIAKYPMFITEWGFENGGTEGGTITYGQSFETWMRTYNLSWTAWSFDILWGPRMFFSDWTLRPSPDGMGVFIRDLLLENHQSN